MKKVALIISGAGYAERKGILDIALTRCEHLKTISEYLFDIYVFSVEYRSLSLKSLFSKTTYRERISRFGYDITLLKHIEFESSIPIIQDFLDWIYKRKKKRLTDWEWQKDFAKYFKGYDLIIAHFNDAAILAQEIHHKFGTPYSVTWHGSDIHTIPFNDIAACEKTISSVNEAAVNFFVSNGLKQISDKLTLGGRKEVLYNGIDKRLFYQYPDARKKLLRKSFGVEKLTVITFAGNLVPIKNAQLLPDIFLRVAEDFHNPLIFWIIGGGPLRQSIETQLVQTSLNFKFWGTIEHCQMPDFFNCTDVLILPSKNEGLGLVVLEALACGCNVVASDVGGIKEILGNEGVVATGQNFIQDFSASLISMIKQPMQQGNLNLFDWEKISAKEDSVYQQILNK